MALVSPPTNVSLVLRINQGDGSLAPVYGDWASPAGFGVNIVCIVNMGADAAQPIGVTIQAIYQDANCGFSLPYARYVLDWGAMKSANNAGRSYVCKEF